MSRRAAPGPQLAAGRLRVDAARAIAKLREYQLAVRAAWVLEAIRAAVASGATRIALTGDTNDLWLAWDGEPWPAADLPRLFDELVGPEASDARYHVRLLAAAVNSALGMDPVHVDVIAIGASGHAVRARYTPEVLAEPRGELGEAPLRQMTVEPIAPPPAAGAGAGMAIHLRRRFGVTVLSHLVRELPELELARAACVDLAVPLLVRGAPHGGGAGARDLLRVPLGEGLRGFVAITDPAGAPTQPMLEVAEHGVVLAVSPVDLGFRDRGVPVPLRVRVDAPRMPTNASRSEVRRDLHPIATALRRAQALLPELAERLAAEVTAGERPERARAAALALVAAARGGEAARLGLGRLLALPLARDAVGAPRPLSAAWSGLVHTGAAPYPAELAPWLGHVLWVPPGDPSAFLIEEEVDAQAVKRLARWARREHRAKQRFYEHAPRPPRVELRERPRLRARLGARVRSSGVDPGRFAGLSGEVCIRARGEGGELVLLLAGRELERLSYQSPIPFTAVIDSPRLAPADRYRGAARDAELARVEAAMRAGVLCAIEAIVTLPASDAADGFVHGEPAPAADRRLALDGLALALELAQGDATGARLAGPLPGARLWPLADGGLASTAELQRRAVIGVAAPGARLRPLARRPIVAIEPRDRALLAALLPPGARLVTYDAALVAPEPLSSIDLAQGLLEERDLALALRAETDGGGACAAAIAPSSVPRVVISHLGRHVEERAYRPALVPCTIHVDADDVVPDAHWLAALDDAGVSRRFAGWEQELLRAAAAALAGERVPDLLCHAPVEANRVLVDALWRALAELAPAVLLGEPLAAKLRARPLFRVLGERAPVSADELAARFPHELPYLDAEAGAEPLAGFAPLVAEEAVAHAAGRLAGRAVRDAASELARHRRAAERAVKLAALRSRPALPLELPGAICVRRKTAALRAVIGVGEAAAMVLEIRVEGRPFATLARPGEPPIAAVIEVPIDRLDDALEAVPPALADELVRVVRAAVPELLAAIAHARPEALADLGPARTLLAEALAVLYLDQRTREALAAAAAFPTLQGPRTSLARAARGGVVAIAGWDGEWLGPEGGEAPSELDRPVLHVPAGADELAAIIDRLHRGGVVDLTEAVDKLQAQRRMARGLLPRPAVHGVAPELRRRLEELGPDGAALGPGEIGLVDEPGAAALLHVHGALRERVPLDVAPPVHLAIEAPELVAAPATAPGALRARAQAAALALLRAVLAQLPVLPAWLRHRLRRALLSGGAAAVLPELAGAPLFETAAGAWVARAALARQAQLFGDVWCVPRAADAPPPLDEHRVVMRLDPDEQELARAAGLPCVDATDELALDAEARANLARPRPAALAIDPEIPTLATVTLDGDGRAAPRGVVAALAPSAALHRGTCAHRELYPFEPTADECLWPTRAVVDDAGLAPDRTWSRAAADARWDALLSAIRKASEAALRDLVRPPPRALASQIIAFSHHADLIALRRDITTQIRGALWLDGPPGEPVQIHVVHARGEAMHAPPPGSALRGTLYVYAAYDEPRIRQAIDELCVELHERLLAKLAARRSPPDVVRAHLAHGLAIGRIAPAATGELRFACFRPRPIDALEWVALCRSSQHVPLVAPDASADELSVTDDGTATARAVLAALGDRAHRDRPAPLPAPPERLSAAVLRDEPARDAHPLDPLVAAVGARLRRLGLAPPAFAIVDAAAPLVAYAGGALAVAGAHPQLRAIAAALLARTAWSAAAVDALAAHVVTVLNVALTSVTDATEAHALGGLLRGG